MAVPLLSVNNLQYAYGERLAVGGVSFDIPAGQVLGLLGPNGAGKTTTISCVAGLLSDWTGAMEFNGNEYFPAHVVQDRRLLGYVPQEIAVYLNLTAEENLHLFGKVSGVPANERKEAVERHLKLAGLLDRRRDLVRTFSGGMKRRLNLAAGLMHDPKLVLLDEPTVGVDPQSRNHLFDTLLELKKQGHSLLYTTHYMEEAQRLCDLVAIMNDGVVVASGTASELAEQAGVPGANLEDVFLQLTGRSLRDD